MPTLKDIDLDWCVEYDAFGRVEVWVVDKATDTILATCNNAEEAKTIIDWMRRAVELGPQRGPASVAQIEAQTKQVKKELGR